MDENATITEQDTSDFETAFAEEETGTEEVAEETVEETPQEASQEETQETSQEETQEEVKVETPATPTTLTINGREYTQEEIAQKLSTPPKNYGVLERLANEAGKNVDDYLKEVEERYEKSQIDERAKERATQLIEQGMEENLANHLAQVEVENANFKSKIERAAQQAQEMGQKQNEGSVQAEQRMQAEIREFDKLYPGVKEFPPEMLNEIKQTGHTPVVAYQNYLLRKQETELKALQQAKKNEETTPGAVKGTKVAKPDAFLSTFMKEY